MMINITIIIGIIVMIPIIFVIIDIIVNIVMIMCGRKRPNTEPPETQNLDFGPVLPTSCATL